MVNILSAINIPVLNYRIIDLIPYRPSVRTQDPYGVKVKARHSLFIEDFPQNFVFILLNNAAMYHRKK